MGTPWDSKADKYLEEWVPRFVPYHLDLVEELVLGPGQKALVTSAGLGAEALAVARAVGDSGRVRATDPNGDLARFCEGQVGRAGFRTVRCEQGALHDVGDEKWDAIVCAFGLWKVEDRTMVLRKWASALAPHGKVGLLTFGPSDETDPFELLSRSLLELEPHAVMRPARVDASREGMAAMFDAGGLSLVRHTVLRHPVAFPTCEAFAEAIREGRTWRAVWEELGTERMGRVLAHFYDRLGGPTAPLTFEPAVTLAIAALPGAEVALATRKSVVASKPGT